MLRPGPVLAVAAWLAAACASSAGQPDDAREIVRRSVHLDQRNFSLAREYNYLAASEVKTLDASGRVRETQTRVQDFVFIGEEPYVRLIEKNGKPLDEKERRQEDERLARLAERRKKVSPAERERRRMEERKFLAEIPEAFEFQMLGEETRDLRPCWVIRATPNPAYRPHDLPTRMLPKVRGKLWIDQETYQWVRAEAETLDTISIGLVLARVGKGAVLEFEQTRVNDEVWLPRSVHIRVGVRVGLVMMLRQEVNVRYSNYRRFRTDTRILPGAPERK